MLKFKIYITIIFCQCLIKNNKFHLIHKYCSKNRIIENKKNIKDSDIEKIFYIIDRFTASDERQFSCLLRSVVAYIVLRNHGSLPTFNIGVSTDPFKAHAWIEINENPVCEYYENPKLFKKII